MSNHSALSLRLGLRMIAGLSEALARRIVQARGTGLFASFDDFTQRTGLSSAVLKRLARADAFGTLELNRREALWQSLPEQTPLPLWRPRKRVPADPAWPRPGFAAKAPASPHQSGDDEPVPALPPLSLQDEVVADYRTAGLSLRGHPLQFIREWLERQRVVPTCALARLRNNRRYRVAGLVLLRQRPGTAKGITFVTLEDEFGTANLIIRQEVWERYRAVAARSNAWIAHGQLQRVGPVIHLLVDRLQDLTQELAGMNVASRDFQ